MPAGANRRKWTYWPNIGPTVDIWVISHWMASNFAAGVLWQQLAGLLRQIKQDRAGLEHGVRLAVRSLRIDDDRHLGVRVQLQERVVELLAGEHIHRLHRVGQRQFLQRDIDLDDVGASHPVQGYHREYPPVSDVRSGHHRMLGATPGKARIESPPDG